MGPDETNCRPSPAPAAHPASVARTTVPRHHPRQEPGALAALAGICAGGGEQSSSLPRPVLLPLTTLDRGFEARGADRHVKADERDSRQHHWDRYRQEHTAYDWPGREGCDRPARKSL